MGNSSASPASGSPRALSRDVAFESAGLRLAGSFTEPDRAGPNPAVLLLAGSGQSDRDDNAPKLRIDVLRQVAEFLALNGFASLRFDKRGVGASEGNYWTTGFDDRVTDAAAGLIWLRSQKDVDPDLAGAAHCPKHARVQSMGDRYAPYRRGQVAAEGARQDQAHQARLGACSAGSEGQREMDARVPRVRSRRRPLAHPCSCARDHRVQGHPGQPRRSP